MSTHTETITVRCPAQIASEDKHCRPGETELCAAEIEVELTFGYDPGQPGNNRDEPYLAPGVEDVEVPDITCDYCRHVFTAVDIQQIADAFRPTRADRDPVDDGPEYEPTEYRRRAS